MDEQTQTNSAEIVSQVSENNSEISDEQNLELIEAFIDDEENTFYKNAFSKYNTNGIEHFAFCFSWGGFVFGAFNLIHRKLYLEGVLWLIGSAVLSGISGGILAIIAFFAGAFINPFLIYKRFKKLLAQCESQKMDYNKKLETLKIMGGTNAATTTILALAVLIAFIVFVVFMVRACVG